MTVRNITVQYYADQDKLEKGSFMFAKEDATKFWDLQKELKDKFYPAHRDLREKTIQETEELIYACREVHEVKILKQSIFKNPVLDLREITQPLWDECDKRIEELQQEAS